MLQVVGIVCYGVRPERSLGSLDLSLGLKQYMAKTRGLNAFNYIDISVSFRERLNSSLLNNVRH